AGSRGALARSADGVLDPARARVRASFARGGVALRPRRRHVAPRRRLSRSRMLPGALGKLRDSRPGAFRERIGPGFLLHVHNPADYRFDARSAPLVRRSMSDSGTASGAPDAPPLRGSIARTPLPQILRQIFVEQLRGTLTLTRESDVRRVYFEKGGL